MTYYFKKSQWDESSVDLRFLSHSEWRGKDVIEIKNDAGKRIGYLMSASSVETDDEQILDRQNISNYVTRGISDHFNISYETICSDVPIEFKEDNVCVLFIHSKSFLASGLSVIDLDATLSRLGFSTIRKVSGDSFFTSNSLSYLQTEIINGSVVVRKIDLSKDVNTYIFKAYLDSLHSFGSPLTQFLMLYQYFEISMGVVYIPRAEQAFLELRAGSISKNDFRTLVSDLSKETGLLTQVLTGISSTRFDFIDRKLIESKIVSPYPVGICDLIYSIRNAIIHRTISFYNDTSLVKDINMALLLTIYDIATK